MALRRVLVASLCVLVFSGCASDPSHSSASAGGRVLVDLTFAFNPPPRELAVQCEAAAGGAETCSPPSVRAETLRAALADEPAAGELCTQVYGGPETVEVSGTVSGRTFHARFSRENGCAIARYDRLVRALGVPPPSSAGSTSP